MKCKKCKLYCVEVSDDGSEFELRFEIDGEIVKRKIEYSFDDILISSCDFLHDCYEGFGLDARWDVIDVELTHRYG